MYTKKTDAMLTWVHLENSFRSRVSADADINTPDPVDPAQTYSKTVKASTTDQPAELLLLLLLLHQFNGLFSAQPGKASTRRVKLV